MSDLLMASVVAMSYGSYISHSSGISSLMKTPPKPFIVEVKRSRSIASPKDAVRIERLIVIEAALPSAITAHSQTRQLAERAFKALAADSNDEREKIVTAESVFPGPAQRLTPQISREEVAADSLQVQTVPTRDKVPPKLRKPRASNEPVATAPAKKPRRLAAPEAAAVETTAVGTLARRSQEPGANAAKAPPSAAPLSDFPLEQQIARRIFGWGPGERWKRRLRHLR